MTENKQNPERNTTEGLKRISEAFAREIGRRPSLVEMLEILAWGLRSLSGDPLSGAKPSDLIAFRPEAKKNTELGPVRSEDVEAVVGELNDVAFVHASDLFVTLIASLKKEHGKPPTLVEISTALADGLRQSKDILESFAPENLLKIKPEAEKRKKISAKVGDVVAIPAEPDRYFIAVVLAKNRFGVAYGFFQGALPIKPVSLRTHPPVMPRPIYSGETFVENGRWKVIGHDEQILSLFPKEPEIYHDQDENQPDPSIGPHGSAESPSGRLREVTRQEAEEVGLVSEQYRQSYLPDILEKHLKTRLKGA